MSLAADDSASYGRGLIGVDNYTHAVVGGLNGPMPRCGLDAISRVLPGRFDPHDPLACKQCANGVRAHDPA